MSTYIIAYYLPQGQSSTSRVDPEPYFVATGLSPVPNSFHVTSDPQVAAFSMTTTTGTLFAPTHTIGQPTINIGGQQYFSTLPPAPHPHYVQLEHFSTPVPLQSTISTSFPLPNHAAVLHPISHTGQPSMSGPSSAPHLLPHSITSAPSPMGFPTESTPAILVQPQTAEHAHPLQAHPDPPAHLVRPSFLDCREFFSLIS